MTFRWVRDVAILEAETWLWLGRVRAACPHCGPKIEALDWLAPYSRLTRRMAENVVRLCKVLPIKHVAEYLGLTWDTVKATDIAIFPEEHRALEDSLECQLAPGSECRHGTQDAH